MEASDIAYGRPKPPRKRAPGLPGAVLDDLALKALGASAAPLSAYDIADRVAGSGRGSFNVSAVYRSLDRLRAQGAIERVETLSAYRLKSEPRAVLLVHADSQMVSSLPIGALHNSLMAFVVDAGFKVERLVVEAVVTSIDSNIE